MFGDEVTNNILGHLNNLSSDFPEIGDLRTHVKSKVIKLQKVPKRSWRPINENQAINLSLKPSTNQIKTFQYQNAVSYTHLTLPTNREV